MAATALNAGGGTEGWAHTGARRAQAWSAIGGKTYPGDAGRLTHMASPFTVYVLVAVSIMRASDGTDYELTALPSAYMSSEKCEIARFFLERDDQGSGPPRKVRCQPVLVENRGEGGQQHGPKSASPKKKSRIREPPQQSEREDSSGTRTDTDSLTPKR